LEWVWDPEKNAANERKHGLDFEMAKLVLDGDTMTTTTRRDIYQGEERWQTIGALDSSGYNSLVVLVVHTMPMYDSVGRIIKPGRIISARKATPHEKRAYAKGYF